jgi:regulator of protease activity HflC (stomatin/prohibitin superfamily)
MWISLTWTVLTGIVIAACLVLSLPGMVVFGVCTVMIFVGITIIARLYLVKSRAMSHNEKSRNVLFGFGRMVLWEPTEGVVFLKNKQVQAVDNNPNDGGGIRIIFPILGEQLSLRVPLTVQSCVFTDHNVFTKDYLPVTVRMTIWWRLTDLERYFLSISQNVGYVSDQGSDDWGGEDEGPRRASASQLNMAKLWITMMAESVCRQELGKTSTAFLVGSQISSELPQDVQGAGGSKEALKSYQATTGALAQRLEVGIRKKVEEYGLGMDRVELQEVRLPKQIHDAAVEACAVAFLPAKAEREAAARKIQLQADADVLGADAVALREVLGGADGMSFMGVPDFLDKLFGRLGDNRRITEKKS